MSFISAAASAAAERCAQVSDESLQPEGGATGAPPEPVKCVACGFQHRPPYIWPLRRWANGRVGRVCSMGCMREANGKFGRSEPVREVQP